jgi:hypothetical protein
MMTADSCCPVLRATTEVQRLLAFGLRFDEYNNAAAPYLIGALRERYGCNGVNRLGHCPWSNALFDGARIRPDRGVPEVHGGRAPDDETGLFL